jgi:hypothetical protein
MVVPAPGTLTVLASSGDKASASARTRVATKRTAKKAATRKAAPERGATTHTASAKKAATKTTTGGAKKTKGVKRPSR